MKFISSKTHGILDYLVGVVMIASPWLFGFANGGPAQIILVIIGILSLGMSLFTDYELGIIKLIPLRFHLNIDVMLGAFLLLSSWILEFAPVISWPHVLLGLLELGAGLFTSHVVAFKTVVH